MAIGAILAASSLLGAGFGGATTAAAAGAGGVGLGTLGLGAATGLGLLGAFSGSSSGGVGPSAKIELTPGGKELEKSLFESIKADVLPKNMAADIIGKAFKSFGTQQRAVRQGASAIAGRGATEGVSGRAITAVTGDIAEQAGIRAGGQAELFEAEQGQARGHLANLQNFMNLQNQTPVLRAQAQFASQEQQQLQGARRGAAIGLIPQLAGLYSNPAFRN